MGDGSLVPTGQASSQASTSSGENKGSENHGGETCTVAENHEQDKAFVEVILSLLARREVETLTFERLSLRKKETQTQNSATTHRPNVDNSQSLEQTLALIETIPEGFHTSENSVDATASGLPPIPLPGGRGVNPPHEKFLQLAASIATPRAPPIHILTNGTVTTSL